MAQILTLADAIRDLVHDGDTVALEGFTHLIPFAAGHEIDPAGRRDLTLIRMTPDLIYDQLIGMGCARKLVFSWGGNPGVGSLHRLRDAVEHGWPGPSSSRSTATRAWPPPTRRARRTCPFARASRLRRHRPRRAHTRTSTRSTCPFTGEALAAVPAHPPRRRRSSTRSGRPRRATCCSGASSACRRRPCSRRARVARHGRGDRRRARARARARSSCRTGSIDAVAVRPGRRAPVLRARLLRPRQRLLHRVGRDQPRPRQLPQLDGGARARRLVRGRDVHARRDDDRRRRARAAERRRLLRRHRPAEHRGEPRAAHARARARARLRVAARSARSPTCCRSRSATASCAETADSVVSVAEMFHYWLQGGRIDVGFLGAAQIDRFGNLNSTVIGDYERPKVRLPGGGGAPEIAALGEGRLRDAAAVAAGLRRAARLPTSRGTDVRVVDHRPGHPARRPRAVSCTLTQLHPGVSVDEVRAATGWDLRVAARSARRAAPTDGGAGACCAS